MMEKIFAKAEELAGDVKEYMDIKIESAKLNAAEKTSLVVANAAAGMAVLVAVVFFAMLFVISLALLIGQLMQRPWAGFMIMAGACLLMAVLIWVLRKKYIQLPVMNALLKQLFNNENGKN